MQHRYSKYKTERKKQKLYGSITQTNPFNSVIHFLYIVHGSITQTKPLNSVIQSKQCNAS